MFPVLVSDRRVGLRNPGIQLVSSCRDLLWKLKQPHWPQRKKKNDGWSLETRTGRKVERLGGTALGELGRSEREERVFVWPDKFKFGCPILQGHCTREEAVRDWLYMYLSASMKLPTRRRIDHARAHVRNCECSTAGRPRESL